MKIFFPLLLICIIGGCGFSTLKLNGVLSATHKQVKSTPIFLDLPIPTLFHEATTFDGYQCASNSWALAIKYTDKSIKALDGIYEEYNLENSLNTLLEKKRVRYADDKNGLWVKFLNRKKSRYRYLLFIDLGNRRLQLDGWIYNRIEQIYGEDLKKGMLSIFMEEIK